MGEHPALMSPLPSSHCPLWDSCGFCHPCEPKNRAAILCSPENHECVALGPALGPIGQNSVVELVQRRWTAQEGGEKSSSIYGQVPFSC